MVIYTLFLIGFHIFGLVLSDSQANRSSTLVQMLMLLPIFGRILGWW
jgi:hypothetical protein